MKKIIIFISILFIFQIPKCFALLVPTHENLNTYIVRDNSYGQLLNLYLVQNLNFEKGTGQTFNSKRVYDWVAWGGRTEDFADNVNGIDLGSRCYAPYTRSINHFHDPLVLDWNNAGYSPLNGLSAIVWAQIPNQSSIWGNYSWPDARGYFYNALIAKDGNERNNNYANCFKSVGQLMHLVQDMSVPAHVRNDAHVFSCL